MQKNCQNIPKLTQDTLAYKVPWCRAWKLWYLTKTRLKIKQKLPRFMLCHLYFYQAFASKWLAQLCPSPFPSFDEFLLLGWLWSSETRVQLWHLHGTRGTSLLGIWLWDKYPSILYPNVMFVTKQGFKSRCHCLGLCDR